MEAKKLAGSTKNASYDEFEPFCNWRREEGRDTLVLHLPEFKKEQMKIQVSSSGALKISGERAINASKRSRFYKEVKVPSGCNVNEIHAKFVNGLLYVVMPKKTSAIPTLLNPPAVQTDQNRNEKTDQITKPTSCDNAAEEAIGKTATNSEFHQESDSIPTSTIRYAKTGMKIGLALALVTAIGAFIFYSYRSSNVGDVDASV